MIKHQAINSFDTFCEDCGETIRKDEDITYYVDFGEDETRTKEQAADGMKWKDKRICEKCVIKYK